MRHEAAMRLRIMLDGMSNLLFISLDEGKHGLHEAEPSGFGKWWRDIGANHPPMNQRLAMLSALAGGVCPTLDQLRDQEDERFNAMIERRYGKGRVTTRRRGTYVLGDRKSPNEATSSAPPADDVTAEEPTSNRMRTREKKAFEKH